MVLCELLQTKAEGDTVLGCNLMLSAHLNKYSKWLDKAV